MSFRPCILIINEKFFIKVIIQKLQIESPYPLVIEEEKNIENAIIEEKYKLKPPRDLRSKFLLMMAQREVDKVNAEKQKLADEEKLRILVSLIIQH